tara:strand:- start:226 stop:453 length:228 start_codon:yes stop_codon:yes gene_type:complete
MTKREFYRVTPKCKTFSSQDFKTLTEAAEFVRQEGIWEGNTSDYSKYEVKRNKEYWAAYAKTLQITKITQTEEVI